MSRELLTAAVADLMLMDADAGHDVTACDVP